MAARRALLTGAYRYQNVKPILKNSLDSLAVVNDLLAAGQSSHIYIAARSTSVKEEMKMLLQPTMEKLLPMRLQGMA
jgi:hypothetical protein